ncbi:hypothetical protein GQ457_05G021950 [Hibiscus cannabinus]
MVVELLVSSVLSGRTIRYKPSPKLILIFFLITFASASNRDNVLKRGPWDFQKHWFALELADPACTIHDYAFRYMCIWVWIHNIPLSLMTEALARTLGTCIGKKLHYGAWLRAPLPKRVSVARPRGRVAVVKDAEVPPLSPAPSVASSPPDSASATTASVPAPVASVPVLAPIGPAPTASEAAASTVPVTTSRVSTGSASMSAPPPRGKETADVDSEVSTSAACSSPLPPVSRPALTCARRLSMPSVPEQDDFEAWYAAQVQAASKAPPPPPFSVGLSSRPASPRPNKHAAPSSDPSRAKRSRPATRTSQAGMSSSSNSSAEAGR